MDGPSPGTGELIPAADPHAGRGTTVDFSSPSAEDVSYVRLVRPSEATWVQVT